ncbi:MAG: heme-binding protein [Desulfobacterales bacterium]|jgi:hypothetical protein
MTIRYLSLAAIWFLCAVPPGMATEEAPYTVLQKDGDFELRQYEPHIVAETVVEGDFSAVGNVGFRRLFDYISGNNRRKQEIAMTAPVSQEASSQKIAMTAPVGQEQVAGKWRVTFMMPTEYTLDTLPEPLNFDVTLREVPGRLIAAIRYSGPWGQARYQTHEDQLQVWIEDNQLVAVGPPIFARYNSPFMIWFLRRNEVLIPVQK